MHPRLPPCASQARLTYARESARNGPPPPRYRDPEGDGNSGFENAQERPSSHRGPKRTAFGVPEGFLPDKESGMYHNKVWDCTARSLWLGSDCA